MFVSDEAYGKVIMNSCVPTVKAKKYLSYFLSAGWHKCNSFYYQKYKDGIEGSLMLLTVGGEGELKLSDRKIRLKTGSVALIPPKTYMEYFTSGDAEWEFYWINIYGVGAENLVRLIVEENKGVVFSNQSLDIEMLLRELIYSENDDKQIFELKVSDKINKLLHVTAKNIVNKASDRVKENTTSRILSYIEKNYNKEITLGMISKKFYISENQLIRNIRKETGFTPYEYLKRYRLTRACELLQVTDKSVEEIGIMAGFSNVSNFIYQFRCMYGITPLRYRNDFTYVTNE